MISEKSITHADGAKILKLDRSARQMVYAQLREGKPVKLVFRRLGLTSPGPEKSPIDAAEALLRYVDGNISFLRDRMDVVEDWFVDDEQGKDLIADAAAFFEEWNERMLAIED